MLTFILNPPTTRAVPWPGDAVSLSQAVLVSARSRGRDLLGLAGALRSTSSTSLGSDSARAAFWINVYNALLRHALTRFGLHGSLRWHAWIFFVAAYEERSFTVGPLAFPHGMKRQKETYSCE